MAQTQNGVRIMVDPPVSIVTPNAIITVDIVVDLGDETQRADAAAAYLNFDPSLVMVVDPGGDPANQVTGGIALPMIMANEVNNTLGTINYAAGALYSEPAQGHFVLCSIRFKAKGPLGTSQLPFIFDGRQRQTSVTYNGVNLPVTASDGQIIVANPTPTPTVTLEPTATPTPTVTPEPTATPTLTPTPSGYHLYLPLTMRAYRGGW